MKGRKEFVFYVSVSVGMALATSVFTMIAGLFNVATAFWIVAGIVLAAAFCSAVALSIGELASMFPSAPGLRTYFKVAFGDFPSLVMIYLYLGFAIIVAGLESFVFSHVVTGVFPLVPQTATVLLLLLLVMAVNLVGYQLPHGLQMASTIGAVVMVLAAGVHGMSLPHAAAPAELVDATARPDGWFALPALVGMSIFLFTGFEWVTPLGLRPSAYRWKIPVSMLAGVAVLAVAYCFFVLGLAAQIPPRAVVDEIAPQLLYFDALYGRWGAYLGLGLSLLAIFSTFNAGILGGSKLIYLLARERNLPAWCGSMSVRTGCPIGAVIALGSLGTASALIVLTWQLAIVAALIGAAIMCAVYAGFLLSTIRLRASKPNASRPFFSPLPLVVQWGLAATLLVIGIQTLFSQPGSELASCVGLALAVGLACVLALRSQSMRSGLPGTAAELRTAPLRTESFDPVGKEGG